MPIDTLYCLGINHHTGSIEQREQMATAVDTYFDGLQSKAILLSTCNRMELYTPFWDVITSGLSKWEQENKGCYQRLVSSMYHYQGSDAIHHLMCVASGLDSMILGEGQILGQVRQSLETAVAHNPVPPQLVKLFHGAIRTGKRVRTETAIGHHPASMSAIALQQAQTILGRLTDKNFLVVGLGEMGQLTLKALHNRGLSRVAVANRTIQKAAQLAVQPTCVFSLEQLNCALEETDVVFTATRSPQPLLTQSLVKSILPYRHGRPLVVVDLAVPRNVETAVQMLPGVTVINIDQLQINLDNALEARQADLPAAKRIIKEEMAYLEAELNALTVTPTIKALRQKAEKIRQSELQRTLRYLKDTDEETRQHVAHLSQALVKKLLHDPTRHLRSQAQQGRADSAVAALRDIFDLTEDV